MAHEIPQNIFREHNHRQCRSSAMSAAESQCEGANLRLTPIRARVLEILLESHRALGAYDILNRLQAEGRASQPPIVYRALEFLVTNGFAHRLERLNAFTACAHAHAGQQPMFLICESCHKVAEAPMDAVADEITARAADLGFHATSPMIEVSGLCPACQTGADT